MSNVLESQRAAHEIIERLEGACVQQFLTETKTYRERLRNEHTVDKYLTRLSNESKKLLDLYEDNNGQRQEDIDKLSKPSINLEEFYKQLNTIKDHHQKYPNEPIEAPEFEFIQTTDNQETEEPEEDALETLFSGEENYGRYLDLNAIHRDYLNLKGIKRIDYIPFLDKVDQFKDVSMYPTHMKTSKDYHHYLDQIIQYLKSYFERAKPLIDVPAIDQKTENDFEQNWMNYGQQNGNNNNNGVDKKPIKTEDLQEENVTINEDGITIKKEEVDEENITIKTENIHLQDIPNTDLYCMACQKSFTKQTVYDAHLKGKKHLKAQAKLDATNNNNNNNDTNNKSTSLTTDNNNNKMDRRKLTAWKETLITSYMKELDNVRKESKANVERKQALTDRERTLEQEQEDIEIEDDDNEDDEEDRIYNPLKLPLGWDGKPIPYWLYKLHGLGVEYPCEICGDYVYMGRKAFDKHFQEWRHAHGMRSLGLSNTRQFHEITKIEDALALNQKLKKNNKQTDVKVENIEEFEDDEGNVFNKKTYEDLKRQGII